jgi:hypothetical protein
VALPPSPISVHLDVTLDGPRVMAKLRFRNDGSQPHPLLRWVIFENGTVDSNRFNVLVDGVEAPYRGIAMKRRPPGSADYRTLEPRETIESTVDLARAYDLPNGTVNVQYDTVNQLQDGKHLEALLSNPVRVDLGKSAK